MLGDTLQQILSGEGAPPASPTDQRILEAVLVESSAHGIDRLSLERVAQRAKVNRATIYRRFGDKEGLLSSLAVREGRRLVATLHKATNELEDPRTRFVEGFVAALHFARTHPTVSHAVNYDPGLLVNSGMAEDAALLRLGAGFMAAAFRWAQEQGQGLHLDADAAGDAAARLFATFVLMPGGSYPLDNEQRIRDYAQTVFVPMFFGPEAA